MERDTLEEFKPMFSKYLTRYDWTGEGVEYRKEDYVFAMLYEQEMFEESSKVKMMFIRKAARAFVSKIIEEGLFRFKSTQRMDKCGVTQTYLAMELLMPAREGFYEERKPKLPE